MAGTPLCNLKIIITRPIHQAVLLKETLIHAGATPVIFPTLSIEPLDDVLIRQVAERSAQYDVLIFTSQNAVTNFAPYLLSTLKGKIAAIGRSTAAALERCGLPVDILPEKFNSEHLIAHPSLKEVADKRILIIGGEGGRNLLEKQLREKGANIFKLPVYRRVCPIISPKEIEKISSLENCVILSTSCESLNNLINIMTSHQKQNWLFRKPVLVISERIKQFALEKKFDPHLLLVAENASEQAILERLIKWYAN